MACIDLNNKAVALIQDNESSSAIEFLNRALLCFVASPAQHYNRPRHHDPQTNWVESEHYYTADQYDEGMTTFSLARPILPGCTNRATIEATIFFNLAIAHTRIQEEAEATLLFTKALEVVTRLGSRDEQPSGPASHAILHNIGHAHFRAGNNGDALESYSQALEHLLDQRSRKSCQGDQNSSSISATLNCIAMVHFHDLSHLSSGDLDNSMETNTTICLGTLNGALSMRSNFNDTNEGSQGNHAAWREIATIINNIGRVKFARGEYGEALQFYMEAYHHRRTTLGDNHLDVAATLFNIAQTHEQLHNTDDAIANYKAFLLIATSKLGEDHGDVVKVLLVIGEIYERIDELEEAYTFLSHALRFARLAVEPAYEIIATILNKLGNVLYDQNKDEAALASYEQGLIIERNLYPSLHKNIAVTLLNIARIDQEMGRYMRALTLFSEALQIARVLNGDRSEEVANILSSIALVNELRGDYSTAVAELTEVLETRQELFGAEHFLVSVTLNSLGLAQSKEGSLNSALISFLRSLQIRRICPESNTRALVTSCYNAATVCKSVGELDQALRLYEEILELERGCAANTDDDSYAPVDLVATLKQLFLICQESGDEASALKHLLEAAQICADNAAAIHAQDASHIHQLLGDTYLVKGDTSTAMKFYTIATRLYRWNDNGLDLQGAFERCRVGLYCRHNLRAAAAAAA